MYKGLWRWFLLAFLLILPVSGYGEAENRLVGISFSRDSLRLVVMRDLAKDSQSFARGVLSGLLLKDGQMYVALSPDKFLFSQVPEALIFSFAGDILVSADIALKRRIREILGDLSDKDVFDFWQAASEGQEEVPKGLKVSLLPLRSEIIRLKDGFLIKDLVLQVDVACENASPIVDILRERLNKAVLEDAEFAPLRQLAYEWLAAQYIKELHRLDGLDFQGADFIDTGRFLFVRQNVPFDVIRKVNLYMRETRRPVEIMFNGWKIGIYGLIDFTGLLRNADIKKVDLSVADALKRLGKFVLTDDFRLVFSSIDKQALVRDWFRLFELTKDWRFWRWIGQRRAQLLVLLARIVPIDMDIDSIQGVHLGLYIRGDFFMEQALSLLRSAGLERLLYPKIGDADVKYIGLFDPGMLAKDKAEKLKGYIRLGWLPFMAAFDKGRVVAARLNGPTRDFFSGLLEGNHQLVNKFISRAIRDEFWSAVKDVKIIYNDSLKQAVYLLLLADEFRPFVDPRVASPWPMVVSYVLEEAGIDLMSGPIVKFSSK